MQVRWQTVVDIDRPIEVVFQFVNDVFNMPRLRGSTLSVRQANAGPVQLGTKFRSRVVILGYEVGITSEVTAWEPPHLAVATLVGGGVKSGSVTESLQETNQGTRLTRSMELDLKPLATAGWIIFGGLMRRRWTNASQNIKKLLENQPTADTEPRSETTADAVSSVGLTLHRTFLFTDIVGSTELVRVIGDAAWRDLRRWHDTTLRRIFDVYRGREVDHAGDGFLVAFERAGDAVACAVEIQRTLVDHRKGAGFAPRLRMGMHSGDVQPDGQAYVGTAVHIAARVASSAEEGQILATAATVAEAQITPAGSSRVLQLAGVADPVSVAAIAW